jgi:hypothetical protein
MKLTSRLLLKLQLKKLEGCDGEIDEVYDFMLHLSEEHAWAISIIASIPGMSILSAIYIIAEIGTDMSSFKTANHLAAWAGLAPKDNRSADKARPSRTKKANQYVKSLLIQCAWAATKTRGTRLSLWYWRNVKRLGDKKAITAVARKLICYIYAMLESGTLYDKSLDVAYADNIGAMKLDAAQKIVGSRKSSAPSFDQSGNNNDDQPAPGRDGTHEETIANKQVESGIQPPDETVIPRKRGRRPKKTDQQTESRTRTESGIESPNETVTPKKRGRPKKVVAPG